MALLPENEIVAQYDLELLQGKTFSLALRWETPPVVYKAITGITQTAPVRVTVPAHGIPDGWRVAITNVKGMTQINVEANKKLTKRDYHQATVIDANTIEINDINASGFKEYVSGGYVQFNTPTNLVGFTARMSIKNKVGGTELFSLTTTNGRITIDAAARIIALNISADDTAAITWASGVYDLEMVSGDTPPVVTALLSGRVTVTKEVTS